MIMKELTIEQKAKLYDEAIKVAKSKIKNDKDHILYEDDIIELFPELAKSEDKIIMKKIIATIHLYYGEPLEDEAKEMIAWLEKQGEQKAIKHNNDATIDSNLNDYCCKVYSALHKENGGNLSFARLQHLTMDIYKWCKEQQKSVEWSEEDLCNIERCITKVEIDKSKWENNGKAKTMVDADDELISWLKSLKDRVQPQPNQEWSDEDKKLIDDTCNLINTLASGYGTTNVTEPITFTGSQMIANIKSKLRALVDNRPQSSWKPSEDEMDALASALSLAKSCGEESAFDLRTLYEQLKKLREE